MIAVAAVQPSVEACCDVRMCGDCALYERNSGCAGLEPDWRAEGIFKDYLTKLTVERYGCIDA